MTVQLFLSIGNSEVTSKFHLCLNLLPVSLMQQRIFTDRRGGGFCRLSSPRAYLWFTLMMFLVVPQDEHFECIFAYRVRGRQESQDLQAEIPSIHRNYQWIWANTQKIHLGP